jgi:hypothetical protein
MFYFHEVKGFGHALGLVPVHGFGPAGSYGAKTAAAGAYISKDHESGRTGSPAFAHVGAIAAFTNGMKFMGVYQVPHLPVILSDGQFHSEPVGLFHSLRSRFAGGDYG